MDDYIKKTEVPSCPPPPDMSNYIHKNDISKQESKPVWHHLMGIADMFKDYFMKHSPKPIKVEHSPKPEPESKPKPEQELKPESKPKPELKPEQEFKPEPKPEPEQDFYGYDKNHMSLFASNDILRPANSFTCNGYAPKRTDTCYYY
jgi:outer membrane biosynthesis protein TonB